LSLKKTKQKQKKPVISTLRRLRQKDEEFKASLVYRVNSRPS
jgi:hypothetical protein